MKKTFLAAKSSYYSWIIAFSALIIISISYGIVLNGFSIYMIPVTEDFGYSRQSFGLCLTIINIMLMIVGIFWGKSYKRFGIHKLMKISAIVLPLSYLAFSFCKRLVTFYICSVFLGISTALLSLLPFAVIIANWFENQRGLALGIGFMGAGVGGMAFSTLAGHWMLEYSWQWITRVTAVIMFFVLVPLVFFVIKTDPKEIEAESWGHKEEKIKAEEVTGLSLKEAKKTKSFWAMILLAVVLGIGSSALSGTIIPHINDLGFDPVYAATLSAIALGAMAIGKIVLGLMFDKIGIKLSTTISIIAIAAGITGLFIGGEPAFHLLVILGMGIGNPSSTMAYPGMIRERFGMASYGAIYGVVSAANYFGISCAPLIVNMVFDNLGSYSPALIAIALLSLSSVALLNVILPSKTTAAIYV